jgi:DNA repair protein RadA/Sms
VAKPKRKYVCSKCSYESAMHMGKCPNCEAWNSLEEVVETPQSLSSATAPAYQMLSLESEAAWSGNLPHVHGPEPEEALPLSPTIPQAAQKAGKTGAIRLQDVSTENAPRFLTGMPELDRVLGGGLLSGAFILIGGDPGIGKSTLMLQAAANLAAQGKTVLYVSGEESGVQIKHRAQRLNIPGSDSMLLLAEVKLQQILAVVLQEKPDVLIIDSVQSLMDANVSGAPGATNQIKACANAFMQVAKGLNITTFLIGHVTKEGQLSGPKLLEHMVDAVLYFEGERYKDLRLLRAVKNRFGSTQEMGVFEMQEQGLRDVTNPSEIFLSNAALHPVPGCVTVCSLEGSRPLLIELQALAGQSVYASPRRVVNGVETTRLHQIVAVLERRIGVSFSNSDLYINVVGGLKIDEPAADLGMAMALLSSLRDIPIRTGSVLMGEIGLTGEVRPVRRWRERLNEAVKIGFTHIVLPVPQGNRHTLDAHAIEKDLPLGVTLHFVQNLREAITACMEAALV